MKKIWTLLWIWAGLFTGLAQTDLILQVTGPGGMPVPGVRVESDVASGYTGDDGEFVLAVKGAVEIRLRAVGYEPVTVRITPDSRGGWRVEAPGAAKVSREFKNGRLYVKIVLLPDTEGAPVDLDQVVVESHLLRVPVHAVVVSDMERKYSQPRTTADLFKDIPGVTLQKRSAMSTEPSIRAFKYEEINLRYDGGFKMVNACPNRMDPAPAHVIPEEVEKIEIIKGPFDVRFGQTFGAIVNMSTRKPVPEKYGWHGKLQAGYELNGNNKVALAELGYAEKKFDVQTAFSYRDFGDYIDGKGDTVPAGFRSFEYSVKAGYNPKPERRLLVDWRQNFTRNVKHPGLMMDSPKDDSYLIGVDYYAGKISDKIKSFRAKAYYSFVDHLMTNGYGMDVPRPNYPGIDARTPVWSRTAGGKIEIAHTPDKDMLIHWGADADLIARDGEKTVIRYVNPMTGQPLDTPVVTVMKVWQDARIYDFGLYGQMSWKRGAHRIWGAGLRVDYVQSEARDPDPGMIDLYGPFGTRTDVVWSGNLSHTWRYPDYQIQVALGRGTRTPSMIERYIYRFIVGRDSRVYIGNPFLKPEVNNQIEVSGVKRWEDFQAGVDVYASYFQNYITAVINKKLPSSGGCGMPPMAPKQFVNVDAYQYGFDVYATYRLSPEWKVSADFSYIYAYNLTLNEPLAQVNPPGGHFKVQYRKAKFRADYRVEWRLPKNEVAESFGETPTPGYWVHDIMAGYKPNAHWHLGISVTNIFDAAYYYHSTFVYRIPGPKLGQPIYEPGRNIGFMVTYKF
ncbi:MAG: TonB-dependent receptor [Chlorobi bacterium]|nr:TonB-dependent receptor [Chlorobiota bacterium]